MLNDRLYLNTVEVFLTSETVISLNYQINNIAELKDRQANYSNTFKLPMNAVNRAIWEDAERPNSNTNLPYRKVPARYIKGGLEIIPDGYAVLERSTNFYQVTIYSGNLVFFDLLGETKISDLDFSDLDETWNETNIIANWNSISPSVNPGLIWALIDYGGLSTTGADYAIDRLLPSLTIKTIMDRIFSRYGFNYSGSFPDCIEFSRLILPCAGDTLQHDAAWVTDKLFLAKLNVALTTFSENVFYKIPFQNDSTSGAFDNGDYYDELNYEYIVGESMYADFLLTVTTAVLFVPSGGGAPSLELYSNLNGVNTLQGSHSVDGTYNYSTGFANWKEGDKICWKIKANCQIKVDVTTEFSNDVANKLIFGSSLQIGGILPDITIYDFIKGLMQMYCVLCSSDPATSTIYFNFFDDIPNNKPVAKDWSDKLHMDESTWEVNYRNSTYGQKNNIKYLADVGGGVTEGFGDGFFTIDDETLPLEKDLYTLPFAASTSHLINSWTVNILVINRGADTGFNKTVKPRICYMEHLEVNPSTYIGGVFSNSYNFGVDFDSVPYGRFKQFSAAPNAGNANGSKDDFRMGVNDSLIDDNFQGIVSVLQQFKMFIGLFKINEIDISELNHFIPIYLKQFASYFYLNQISGFKGDALTKCALVKLGDESIVNVASFIPKPLRLIFTNINTAVPDPTDVNDWNTFFDLPANGNPFQSLKIVGNEVKLYGASNVTIIAALFENNDNLINIIDDALCIVEVEEFAFNGSLTLMSVKLNACTTFGNGAFNAAQFMFSFTADSAETFGNDCFNACAALVSVTLLKAVSLGNYCFASCINLTTFLGWAATTLGNSCFQDCVSLTTIYLPACTALGTTTGDDSVFSAITGNTITLTIKSGTETDDDVTYLQSNNGVTLIIV